MYLPYEVRSMTSAVSKKVVCNIEPATARSINTGVAFCYDYLAFCIFIPLTHTAYSGGPGTIFKDTSRIQSMGKRKYAELPADSLHLYRHITHIPDPRVLIKRGDLYASRSKCAHNKWVNPTKKNIRKWRMRLRDRHLR